MSKTRTELIHCDNCGEDYAATYRRCPFCNAKPGQTAQRREEPDYDGAQDGFDGYETGYEDPPRHRGGKRLAVNRRSSYGGGPHIGKIIAYLVALAVILAAIWIVATKLLPKVSRFLPGGASTPPTQAASAQPSDLPSSPAVPSGDPAAVLPSTPPAAVTDDPLSLDSPDLPSVEPDPVVTPAPAAGLKLSSTDFTMSPKYPTYQMEIAGVGRAQATYSMKNEAVATVNSTGLITAVANGVTTLTVTDQAGNTATATVRVAGMSAPSGGQASPQPEPQPDPTPSPAGQASLNITDFTISAAYPDPVRLTVRGGTAASWSSSDESVATVSANGTVTGVSNGSARITCTLSDGSTLRCQVRVSK